MWVYGKKEENRSSLKKNKQKKKGGKSVRQLVKQSVKTSDNSLKARSIGGNVEEYIMQLIKLKDVSVDIGEGNTLVKGGAVLSTEKSKIDSVTIYKIISDIKIEDMILQKEEVSEARWFSRDELDSLRDEDKVIPHIEEFDMIYNILDK